MYHLRAGQQPRARPPRWPAETRRQPVSLPVDTGIDKRRSPGTPTTTRSRVRPSAIRLRQRLPWPGFRLAHMHRYEPRRPCTHRSKVARGRDRSRRPSFALRCGACAGTIRQPRPARTCETGLRREYRFGRYPGLPRVRTRLLAPHASGGLRACPRRTVLPLLAQLPPLEQRELSGSGRCLLRQGFVEECAIMAGPLPEIGESASHVAPANDRDPRTLTSLPSNAS